MQDSTGALHWKQYLQEKIRIKTMAFIHRWKISQNWEQNAIRLVTRRFENFQFKPGQRHWSLFENGLRPEETVLEGTKSLISERTISCHGSVIPFNLPPPPKKMVIRTPLKLVNKCSKSGGPHTPTISAVHLNYTVHAWIAEAIRV